jgi:hypothetical protein
MVDLTLQSINFIKFINNYYKDYNIKHKSWSEIMKDKNIPIELRNLLNGVRYLFVQELYQKLINECKCLEYNKKTNIDDLLIIYPTGSHNLSSDIDVQINININLYKDKKGLMELVNTIIFFLNFYKKLWKVESIERVLDINFYPPTILNFVKNKKKSKYVLFSNNQTNKYITIWKPQFTNKTLIDLFVKKEQEYLNLVTNTNTKKYYKMYNKIILNCLFDLLECYKGNECHDQDFNSKLLCLIQYNNIGPEMYKTYSSILIVVWHLQMKNKVPLKIKRICCKIAYKENRHLYLETKKQKYKDRYEYCKKYM